MVLHIVYSPVPYGVPWFVIFKCCEVYFGHPAKPVALAERYRHKLSVVTASKLNNGVVKP